MERLVRRWRDETEKRNEVKEWREKLVERRERKHVVWWRNEERERGRGLKDERKEFGEV